MTNTYRLMLAWTHDGVSRYGNSRKSRSRDKPMDRRIQRREHAKVIREELRYHDADATADREEQIRLNQENEDAWYAELDAEYEYGLSDDEAYELDHPGYHDDHDVYDPFWDIEYNESPYDYDHNPYDNEDRSYVGGSLSKQGLTRFDMNARIKDEDVGRPLGDVLQDILNKRN